MIQTKLIYIDIDINIEQVNVMLVLTVYNDNMHLLRRCLGPMELQLFNVYENLFLDDTVTSIYGGEPHM